MPTPGRTSIAWAARCYYLLTGRPPFAGDTVTQKILAHREQPVPSLRAVRPDVPEWLDGVFRKMLAKRPEDRQQTMGEVWPSCSSRPAHRRQPPVGPAQAPGNVDRDVSLRQGQVETSSEQVESLAADPSGRDSGRRARDFPPLARQGRACRRNWLRQPATRVQKIAHRRRRMLGLRCWSSCWASSSSCGPRKARCVVEIDDPNVTVQVLDGEGKVQIERTGEKGTLTIAVDPGKHRLRVQKDGMEMFAKDFTIASGGTETIKATWEPASPDLVAGPEPPPAVAPFDAKKAKEHQEAWAKHLGVPVEITNSIGMKLVLIPPGEFEMGSPKELIEEELKAPDDDQWYKERLPGEGPQHRVRITRPFYLGVYAVTQEEYQRVMGTNPSEFSATGKGKDKVAGQDTKRFPVENGVVGRCGGVLPEAIGDAGGEGGGATRIGCHRRRSGSMRAVRGARVGTASVRAAAGFPRNTTRTGCPTTGGSTAIPLA